MLGLSDHTPNNYTSFAALGKGVSIIEKHFIDHRKRIGPDISASIDKLQLKELIKGSKRNFWNALPGKKIPVKQEQSTAQFAFFSCIQ